MIHNSHKNLTRLFGGALALLCQPLASFAGSPEPKNPVVETASGHPMYLGTVTTGVKTSDVYTEGNFSIVAPVWSSLGADATLSGGVVFLEPYISYGEGGEIASSLGLGYRYLFGGQPVSALTRTDAPQAGFMEEGFFVGTNVFVDMLDTESNNQFWQLGVGLEFGTRYLEVRGNYYIPLSDKQLAEQTRTRESFSRSSTRSSTALTSASDPYATGYTIAQDATFTTRTTTTTSTTTIERLFSRYEEGMEGWDAEVAVLVPGLDKYFDLRIIGGYYSFDNQPFGPQQGGTGNVEGWKAGVEIRPVPAIILTGTWYEDDRLTGSDWTVGVQVQIPFEAGDLGDGKTFLSRISDAFKPRRRHLAERLAEPVHRQNAAVKIASTVDVDTKTSTSTKSTTKTSQSKRMIILANDIVFVNNDGPVGNGIETGDTWANGADGTAERPFNTVTEGAIVAGNASNASSRLWSVYTQGSTGTTYVDDAVLTGSTRFISSFTPITGLAGKVFGGNTDRPEIEGGFYAENIQTFILTGYSVFEGFDTDDGVFARNVQNIVINDNLFDDIDDTGIEIESGPTGTSNVVVDNNSFGDASDEAFRITSYGDAEVNLAFTNNGLFSGADNEGLHIHSEDNSTFNAFIDGNLFDGDYDEGIHLDATDDSSLFARVSNNTFLNDIDQNVIRITADDDADLGAFVTRNQFGLDTGDVFEDGINVVVEDDATAGVLISRNSFGGRFEGNAMVFNNEDDDSTLYTLLYENDLTGTFEDNAIDFNVEDESLTYAFLVNNRLSGTFYDNGVDLLSEEDAYMVAFLYNNDFSGRFYDSVFEADTEGDGFIGAYILTNRFNGNVNDWAIDLNTENGSSIDATVADNVFSGTFGDGGINSLSEDTSDISLDVTGNRFPGTFALGLNVIRDDASTTTLTVSENTFNGTFTNDGIFLAAHDFGTDGSELVATITENAFTGTFQANAIDAQRHYQTHLDLTISDNRFAGEFGTESAIYLESFGETPGSFDASVTDNLFNGQFAGSVIQINSSNSSVFNASITGNRLPEVASAAGDFLNAASVGTSVLTITDFNSNLVRGPVDRGFVFSEGGGTLSVTGTLDNPSRNVVNDFFTDDYILNGTPTTSFRVGGTNVVNP